MQTYDSLPNVVTPGAIDDNIVNSIDYDDNEEEPQHRESNCPTRPYSKQINDHEEEDTDCLIHGCTRFSSPVTFLALMVPLYSLFVASATYMGGCISTIEKHFQLSSSQSGMIATVNEIVNFSLVIFSTYYASKCHIPRIISVGCIIQGVGHFLLSMPHFTSDPIAYGSHLVVYNDTDTETSYIDFDNELCFPGEVVGDRCTSGDPDEEQPLSVTWLVIGQILIGLGSAPIFPLTMTYLDDSTVDSSTTSIYIAAIFMAMAIGPFIGFVSSFKCLSLYVDFDRVDEQNIPSNSRDPRWIGAWWLGFAVAGVIIVMISIPLFFFPRKLKKYECSCFKRSNSESLNEGFSIADVYNTNFMQDNGIISSIRGLMKTTKRLLTNPTVVFLKLSIACDVAIMGGFAFFSAKYVEKQFAVSPSTASIILGGINLPGIVFANILSSFCVKKFKLTQFGLSKMLATLSIVSVTFAIPLLFIGCSNPNIAGVTKHYNTSYNQGLLPDFNSKCNSDCACPDRLYKPVCGSDGMTYASACHAGCIGVWKEDMEQDLEETSENDTTMFTGCRCIGTDDVWQATDATEGGIATEGSCGWSCDKVLPFAIIVAFVSVFAAMKPNPSLMLSLRCVDPEDRALVIAFAEVLARVLGYFPAPIYFGVVISSTCLVRQESCSREGACLVYDLERYRYSFIGLFVGLKVIAVICAFCIWGSINPDRLGKGKSKPMELVHKDIVRQQDSQEELTVA